MLEAKKRFKTLGRPWPDNFAREYRMFVTCETPTTCPTSCSKPEKTAW